MATRPGLRAALGIAILISIAVTLGVVAAATTPNRSGRAISTNVQTKHGPATSPTNSPARPSNSPTRTASIYPSYSLAQLAKLPDGSLVHSVVQPFGTVTLYKIKPGDSLWDIARTFAVAGVEKTLYDWNRSAIGQNPDLIHPGTIVIVDPTGKVTAR